jgi:CrcB protein
MGPGPGDPTAPSDDATTAIMAARPLLQVALGGALGTLLRLLAAAPLLQAARGPGPLRLLALNVLGGALLGALVARRGGSPTLERWWPLVATGLLGGATTFSSMVVAAGRLGHDLGLVDPTSARMTPSGLALTAAYLITSIALGLVAFVLVRGAATSDRGRRRARS